MCIGKSNHITVQSLDCDRSQQTPNFTYFSTYFSLDINECTSGVAECSEVCVNTEGSFHCSCYDPGYKVADDGVSCTGKNI